MESDVNLPQGGTSTVDGKVFDNEDTVNERQHKVENVPVFVCTDKDTRIISLRKLLGKSSKNTVLDMHFQGLKDSIRHRKVWAEPVFAEAQDGTISIHKEDAVVFVHVNEELKEKCKDLKWAIMGYFQESTDTDIDLKSKQAISYPENKEIVVKLIELMKTGEILGKGSYAEVFVVKDLESGQEIALKCINKSDFEIKEVQAWTDLLKTGYPPDLYCIMEGENIIAMFMEKIKRSVTLRIILDDYIDKISEDKDLLRRFSIFVIHNLITLIEEIHEEGWNHNDLHADNILLQQKDYGMKLRLLDFGCATERVCFEEDPVGHGYDYRYIKQISKEFGRKLGFGEENKLMSKQLENTYSPADIQQLHKTKPEVEQFDSDKVESIIFEKHEPNDRLQLARDQLPAPNVPLVLPAVTKLSNIRDIGESRNSCNIIGTDIQKSQKPMKCLSPRTSYQTDIPFNDSKQTGMTKEGVVAIPSDLPTTLQSLRLDSKRNADM